MVEVGIEDAAAVEADGGLNGTKRRNGYQSQSSEGEEPNEPGLRPFGPFLVEISRSDFLDVQSHTQRYTRLCKDGKIKSIEEIYLFSLPVKEYQIIDLLLPKLKGRLRSS